MESKGYRVELFGAGGIPMSVAQLPWPPSPPAASPLQNQQLPIRAAPPAPPSEESLKYARLLDHLVAQDSRSWAVNRYDQGSMKDATVEQSANGKPSRIKAYYTYNNGQRGWVEAEMVNGRLSCLTYWDFPNNCRKLGQGMGKQLEAAAEEAARNERLHPTPRSVPSQSQEPSWFTCHYVYGGAPLIAGMAGCPPW